MIVPGDVLDSLRGGLSLLVASCDAHGRPACARGVGVRIWDDREHVTLFLPDATARATGDNLIQRPRVAFVMSRPHDYRTVQMKGLALRVRQAADTDRACVEAFVNAFAELVDGLGVPRSIALRVNHWPCLAIDVAIEDIFLQTPGPGAGAPLSELPP